EGLLDHVLQCLGLAVADDDAPYAEIDCLLDLLALLGRILLALEDVQIDAQRLSLTGNAGFIGLEIVALRQVADQRYLDSALVKGRWRTRDSAGGRAGDDSPDEGQAREAEFQYVHSNFSIAKMAISGGHDRFRMSRPARRPARCL